MPPALPASPPAAPAAKPVSQETRLAYVLRHFCLVYEAVPAGSIGYAGSQAPVEVPDGAADFFDRARPYPASPNWRTWLGQRVPFFFDAAPQAPLLTLTEGRAFVGADVISAAFYLLSGWQEYFSDERDRHGRFPYAASVQQRYGFVAMPVVNYYFDVLKTAVEHVTGQKLRPRSWDGGASFAAFITHDIDHLHSAWKAPAKAALRRGQLAKFGGLCWQRLTGPDAWDNLETVAAATARYGARSTFFILPEHRRATDGTPNSDYALTDALRARLHGLSDHQRCEIGLHGSIGTAEDAPQLLRERRKLANPGPGLRFHYLRWEPRRTPQLVAGAGFGYDSTLGFAEHFGFRHSYCHPFYPFDFQTQASFSFLEIPLNVMDATLHHPSYLQLQPQEVLPALQPMLTEIERFGGVATLLWHNENFDPANGVNGPRQFAELLEELQQRGAAFTTGARLAAEMLNRTFHPSTAGASLH